MNEEYIYYMHKYLVSRIGIFVILGEGRLSHDEMLGWEFCVRASVRDLGMGNDNSTNLDIYTK